MFLAYVRCSGNEESLLDCPSEFVTNELCSSHTRDVGVKCIGMSVLYVSKVENYLSHAHIITILKPNYSTMHQWNCSTGQHLCESINHSSRSS